MLGCWGGGGGERKLWSKGAAFLQPLTLVSPHHQACAIKYSPPSAGIPGGIKSVHNSCISFIKLLRLSWMELDGRCLVMPLLSPDGRACLRRTSQAREHHV